MSSADEKHQKRLVRMLSKYGEVKKPVVERRPKAAEVDGKHINQTPSEPKVVQVTKRSSDASSESYDEVDCPSIKNGSSERCKESNEEQSVQNQFRTNRSSSIENKDKILLNALGPESEQTDHKEGTEFGIKPFDFFACDMNAEKPSEKPFLLINSFGNSEIPLIPTNFYKRKNTGFFLRWTGFKCLNKVLDSKPERHIPIFTYYLMLIEVILFLVILLTNGTGYFGFNQRNVTDIVRHQSNSLQPVTYSEPSNIWIGPRTSILIRTGAIFSPCMKKVKHIHDNIQAVKRNESETGCCIRLDNSGCVQTPQESCSRRTSVWIKFKNGSGPLCGQDPKYCSGSEQWPAKITDWPICKKSNNTYAIARSDNHMKCKVQAKPCCIGIYGKCQLVSEEYCAFVKGTFHPKARLCSQVNCLNDVCGLISFDKKPNQMYRLVMSLFVHAGILQIIITLLIQYFFQAVIEETYGTRKILFLYGISGIGGNLASAIFLPETPEIGPMGAFFGILSLLLYQVISNWDLLHKPFFIFLKTSCCLPIIFVLGFFVPWINNFSNIFGFIFGSLTVPLMQPNNYKNKSFYISLTLLLLLSSSLFVFFYNSHLVEPYLDSFKYLNCLPLTEKWCSMDVGLKEIKVLN